MKIKDITEWSERWSTPSGTMDAMHLLRTVCWSVCPTGQVHH
jgi:hypothetical protein